MQIEWITAAGCSVPTLDHYGIDMTPEEAQMIRACLFEKLISMNGDPLKQNERALIRTILLKMQQPQQ